LELIVKIADIGRKDPGPVAPSPPALFLFAAEELFHLFRVERKSPNPLVPLPRKRVGPNGHIDDFLDNEAHHKAVNQRGAHAILGERTEPSAPLISLLAKTPVSKAPMMPPIAMDRPNASRESS